MQAEVSACVSGLANVLFCAWAVHYFDFLFLSLSSKLSGRFGLLHLAVTVWLSGVREFEAPHFQVYTEPIRLFIILFFTPIVNDELAMLQRRTAVELPAETRITFSFC